MIKILNKLSVRLLNLQSNDKGKFKNSFDKGFYSKINKELLSFYISQLVMPKKGKLNLAEKEQESDSKFKKIRNKHSAVESNINELEHR